MKNFALLFITLFGVFNAHTAFGQQKKIDIDHFKRKMEFLGLPNSNKLKAFNTYNISFTAKQESINTLEITAKDIASFFHLEGHSYLQTGDADFIYSIQIGEPTILKEELIELEKNINIKKEQFIKIQGALEALHFMNQQETEKTEEE